MPENVKANPIKIAIIALSVCLALFHLYTASFGVIQGIGQKSVHLGFVMAIFFLQAILSSKTTAEKMLMWLMLGLSMAGIVYVTAIDSGLQHRIGLVYTSDKVFGAMLVVAIIAATWRKMGSALVIVTSAFIIYGFFGQYFPGFLNHPGITFRKFISLLYLTTDGIFGTPLYACTTYVYLFVLLGAILEVTGVGDYFTEIATSIFGKMRGGPAKVAVVASGLFGSISGSPTANVIGTGTFTIPMMKKTGYEPEFAAAVEASASTGGALMPPIMGSTAFIIAEFLGVPYFQIAKAALIPAVLYYMSLMFAVDIYARKYDLKGADISHLPSFKSLLKQIYFMAPIVFLVIALGVLKLTISRAGLYSCLLSLAISMVNKRTRINLDRLVKIPVSAARSMSSVTIACAIAGIISGVIMGTGLGYRLSSLLIEVSNGHTIILLVLTMIVSLIMGMGVPTTAAYLVLAVLVAPALIKMGIDRTAAHLFIFYFGCISSITPPVALASYAAAGLAGCNATKTGYVACRIAFSAFLLPYMFAYNQVLLFRGPWYAILGSVFTALLGVYMLASGWEGYFVRWRVSALERILLFAGAIGCIIPEIYSDIAGIVIMVSIFAYRSYRSGPALQQHKVAAKPNIE